MEFKKLCYNFYCEAKFSFVLLALLIMVCSLHYYFLDLKEYWNPFPLFSLIGILYIFANNFTVYKIKHWAYTEEELEELKNKRNSKKKTSTIFSCVYDSIFFYFFIFNAIH